MKVEEKYLRELMEPYPDISCRVNMKSDGPAKFDFWLPVNSYKSGNAVFDDMKKFISTTEELGFVFKKAEYSSKHTPHIDLEHENGRTVRLWAIYYGHMDGRSHDGRIRTLMKKEYPPEES